MENIVLQYFINAIFAALPAVGFAMVFNVPRHTLLYCAFGGAIAYSSRYFLMDINFSIELSTFIASTLVGVISVYWSRKFIVPRPVYTIASIIPLLPGTYAFTSIINLIEMNSKGVTPELISMFVDNSLKSIIILGAIGFGLALPSLYLMRYNRPVL